MDVFGKTVQELQQARDQKTCPCPKCGTVIGVSKCAPHLEKCMGMGRNTGRLATKRPPVILESDSDDSEGDDGDDYIPDNKGSCLVCWCNCVYVVEYTMGKLRDWSL